MSKENTFNVLAFLTDNSFSMTLSSNKKFLSLYETCDYQSELNFNRKQLHDFIKELIVIENQMIDK